MVALILKTVGVAVLITAVLLTLSWKLWDRSAEVGSAGKAGAAAAFVLAFGTGYCLVNNGIPPFPPDQDTINWIPYIALLAGGLGSVHVFWSGPWWVRWGLRLLLVRFSFWLVMEPIINETWTSQESILWAWGWDGSVLFLWWGIEELEKRSHGSVVPFLFLISGTAGSLLLISRIDYASMAQLVGVFCGITGVFGVATLWKKNASVGRGVVPLLVLLLPLMMVTGSAFSFGTMKARWSYLALGFVPLSGWLGCLSLFSEWKNWQKALVSGISGFLLTMLFFSIPRYQSVEPGESGSGGSSDGQDREIEERESGDPYGDDYGYD